MIVLVDFLSSTEDITLLGIQFEGYIHWTEIDEGGLCLNPLPPFRHLPNGKAIPIRNGKDTPAPPHIRERLTSEETIACNYLEEGVPGAFCCPCWTNSNLGESPLSRVLSLLASYHLPRTGQRTWSWNSEL